MKEARDSAMCDGIRRTGSGIQAETGHSIAQIRWKTRACIQWPRNGRNRTGNDSGFRPERQSALVAGPVDLPARLVEIAVQPPALFVGQALRTFRPFKALGPVGAPLALSTAITAVTALVLPLGRAHFFMPRSGRYRHGLQGRPCQKNCQPGFHAPRSVLQSGRQRRPSSCSCLFPSVPAHSRLYRHPHPLFARRPIPCILRPAIPSRVARRIAVAVSRTMPVPPRSMHATPQSSSAPILRAGTMTGIRQFVSVCFKSMASRP